MTHTISEMLMHTDLSIMFFWAGFFSFFAVVYEGQRNLVQIMCHLHYIKTCSDESNLTDSFWVFIDCINIIGLGGIVLYFILIKSKVLHNKFIFSYRYEYYLHTMFIILRKDITRDKDISKCLKKNCFINN